MQIFNMREAKPHLSRLVDEAVKGDGFIIAKAGKPLVKVSRLDAPAPNQVKRIGFMLGKIQVPDDFDKMGKTEATALFGGQ